MRRHGFQRRVSALILAAAIASVTPAGAFPAVSGAAAPPVQPPTDPAERLSLIEQAMWERDSKTVPRLRDWAERDDSERVRERSVGALAILGDTGAGPILLQRLSKDPSPRVRRAAAEAIGILKISAPPQALTTPLLKDADPLVRAECARAIGRTANRPAGPVLLISAAQDTFPEVRALSLEALSLFAVPGGVDLIRLAAESDSSPLVRLHAMRALGAVDPLPSLPVFREAWLTASDPDLRLEAFRQLLAHGNPSEWENAGMADPDERVRFLSLRSWLSRISLPIEGRFPRHSEIVRRMESFLTDKIRGIRDLARESLEKQGFKVRESGFVYVLQE